MTHSSSHQYKPILLFLVKARIVFCFREDDRSVCAYFRQCRLKKHRFVGVLLGLVFYHTIWASAAISLPFTVNTQDKASLQRGARFYMNYCSGCHSLKYLRYSQMAKDFDLTTFEGQVDSDLLIRHLVFTNASIYDPIEISMPMENAKQWFGVVPPDLSLVARSRGPAWIYAFLQGFYEDEKRPFGSNNLIFPDVAMPDVLYPLRGQVRLISTKKGQQTWTDLVLFKSGTMSPEALDQSLEDLVNFLVYVGEPVRDERKAIGVGVLIFLGVFLVFLRSLQNLYWKRVK